MIESEKYREGKQERKLDYRGTVGAKRKATTYLWYNGSTSSDGGEKVEETEVKAKGRKARKRTPY